MTGQSPGETPDERAVPYPVAAAHQGVMKTSRALARPAIPALALSLMLAAATIASPSVGSTAAPSTGLSTAGLSNTAGPAFAATSTDPEAGHDEHLHTDETGDYAFRRVILDDAPTNTALPRRVATAETVTDDDGVPAPVGASARSTVVEPTSVSGRLRTLVREMPLNTEQNSGFNDGVYPIWDASGGKKCTVRERVLIDEATKKPKIAKRCALKGGQWKSPYDSKKVTDVRAMTVDHVVALSEAHGSGALIWDADTRRAFANDIADPRSLVAVTKTSERAKGEKDFAEWTPRTAAATCQYLSDYVSTKIRWGLTVDTTEFNAMNAAAAECKNVALTIRTARRVLLTTDPQEPTDPTDPQEPTDPTDPQEPVDPQPTVLTATPSPAIVAVDRPAVVTGSAPGPAGQTVELQRSIGGRWVPFSTTTTRADGSYTLTSPSDYYNTNALRVRVPASAGAGEQVTTPVQQRVVPAYQPIGRDGDYALLFGDPRTRWNPCVPITYRVNTSGAYPSALADARAAVEEIRKATGFRFEYLGASSVTAFVEPNPADTDLLISFSTPQQVPELQGSVAGIGGSFAYSTTMDGPAELADGFVAVDRTDPLLTGFGPADRTTFGQVLVHEIGHAMGLLHAERQEELMAPVSGPANYRLGLGDISGLNLLGAKNGCLSPSIRN